jgi:hypothetical protein
MNRRDATLIAHLDAIEGRLTDLILRVDDGVRQLRDDVAGIKLELATHRHDDGGET